MISTYGDCDCLLLLLLVFLFLKDLSVLSTPSMLLVESSSEIYGENEFWALFLKHSEHFSPEDKPPEGKARQAGIGQESQTIETL